MKDDTLHIVLRLRAGGGGEPPVERSNVEWTTLSVDMRINSTGKKLYFGHIKSVVDLKRRIEGMIQIPPERQLLRYNGVELSDGNDAPGSHSISFRLLTKLTPLFTDRQLPEVGFIKIVLIVRPKVAPTLGIGPGGRICQQIKGDKSDPRLWDVANSRILHVQIVNSQAFKDLTGLDPPDTPINQTMYEDIRFPFLQDWKEKPESQGDGEIKVESESKVASESRVESESKVEGDSKGRGKGKGKGVSGNGLFDNLRSVMKTRARNADAERKAVEFTRKYAQLDAWVFNNLGYKTESAAREELLASPVVMMDADDTYPLFKAVIAEDVEAPEVPTTTRGVRLSTGDEKTVPRAVA